MAFFQKNMSCDHIIHRGHALANLLHVTVLNSLTEKHVSSLSTDGKNYPLVHHVAQLINILIEPKEPF